MGRIVTFGELMIRLAPIGYYRFFQNDQMQATFGGSEANVAVSLAQFGLESRYVTKLPSHAIGQAGVDSLRYFGVDTSKIVRGGDRVGIYFIEKGIAQRSSDCIYDRKNSSFAASKKEDFDWDDIFEGASWFHFSGITPALSDEMAEICEIACKEAKKRNMTVSCDLNYRSKLWDREKAAKVIGNLCRYADVCISNSEEVRDLFGIEEKNRTDKEFDYESRYKSAKILSEKFGFKKVALILRNVYSVHESTWSGIICDSGKCCHSKTYRLHIVDGVGGGDAFCAGIIYSLCKSRNAQDTVEFAVAASALKYTVEGDYNRITAEEAERLAESKSADFMQR